MQYLCRLCIFNALSLSCIFNALSTKILKFVHKKCILKIGRDKTMKTNKRKMVLGAILRLERTSRRISQETLGKVVGVGKTTISAYELGKISPDIETLDAMCTYMNLDYIDVLRQAQKVYDQLERAQKEAAMYNRVQDAVVAVMSSFKKKEDTATAEPNLGTAND